MPELGNEASAPADKPEPVRQQWNSDLAEGSLQDR